MVNSNIATRPLKDIDTLHDEIFYHLPYTSLVLDIGGVLLDYSAPARKESFIPKEVIHRIFRSSTWFEFERGKITQADCYRAVAEEIGRTQEDVSATFAAMRLTLQLNDSLMRILRAWKQAKPALRVYAMSNISSPDWEYIRGFFSPEDLALFDHVFTSASAGIRKPDLGFYRLVLADTKLDPRTTLYVDDRLDNVVSARSFGLSTVTFRTTASLLEHLRERSTRCPRAAALAYLSSGVSKLSVTGDGQEVREIFTELLEREACGDRMHIEGLEQQRLVNFFKDTVVQRGARNPFPPDLDTTAIAWTVASNADEKSKHSVMDEMLNYVNADGIVQSYFDVTRPRIDPVACVNVLYFFYANGRGDELAPTLDWVCKVLEHRAYLDGTLYYCGAEPFLYFLSRLATVSPVRARLQPLLRNRIAERFGANGDALALAMRIVAAARSGLYDLVDHRRLLALQEPDGSWPIGWMYNYGGSGVLFGNKRLTAAVAVQALRAVDRLEGAKAAH